MGPQYQSTSGLLSSSSRCTRPQRFLISLLPRLNEEGFLKGMLLPEKIGLVGFSMGGYGALRTIGARPNAYAREQAGAVAAEMAEAADYRGVKAVKAAALFAPATFLLDETRTEDIDIPTLWFCGTADETVHYEAVRRFCEGTVHSDRTLVSYRDCGHNVANNPAPPAAYARPWEIFKRWSDPVWDTWRLNNANAHFLTAFMDLHLREDKPKADYLQPTDKAPLKGFTEGTAVGIRVESFV